MRGLARIGLPPRAAGLACAAALVAAVAAIMLIVGDWNGELLATALLLAYPAYVFTRDGNGERKKRPEWIPPWERTGAAAGRR